MIATLERRAALSRWLRLVLTPGLSLRTLHELIRKHGSPENLLATPFDDLQIDIGPGAARALLSNNNHRAQAIALNLSWGDHPQHHLLSLDDPEYPEVLRTLSDPPLVLWAIGQRRWLNSQAMAVVGSRQATQGGLRHAHEFARTLAQAGLTIVSGLALGIDAAAHRGALASPGGTIAVLGHGLDHVYPTSHVALAKSIAAQGLLLSEFALGAPALRDHFPRRNRLIAALGLGVLVVEAARSSGSLITARFALELGRDVFAIPGSIDSTLSKGCHDLIKQGAKLVEDAHDILCELPPGLALVCPQSPTDTESANATSLDTSAMQLLSRLGWDPSSIDELISRSENDPGAVYSGLLALELAGVIERLPDGRIQQLRC